MAQFDLPVILLRGLVLFPHNEIRLEFDNDISHNVLTQAELKDNNVLIVNQATDLEANSKIESLPLLGVVAHIDKKVTLTNGRIRVFFSGLYRAKVIEYSNSDATNISAVIEPINEVTNQPEELVLKQKLHEAIASFITMSPYMTNFPILNDLDKIKSLSEMTDMLVPLMPIDHNRFFDYLNELNASKRAEMLLKDIDNAKAMFNIDKDIDTKVQKNIDNAQKEYVLRERIKAIHDELGDTMDEVDDLRSKADALDAPDHIKKRLTSEINKYENTNSSSPEQAVILNYIHWLLDLPWHQYTIDNEDLKLVRERLDESHSGLDKVKTRIIEYLAVKQMTKSLKAPIMCLVGPPGVGKTSLAFSIASAINRKFVKISVGGVNDEAEIVGHRRTYVGANPGRIIEGMKKAGSSNPVFLIDEIDKMTSDYHGDPASTLLEVLDPEQNKLFSDNYIEEEYDLSEVMFITTANDINDIPEALIDRLEVIYLPGYTEYEKLAIAKTHLLPKVCQNHGLASKQFVISDNFILKIIREYTKEAGVRELERQMATIVRKIVTDIVINKRHRKQYVVTQKMITEYLGLPKYLNINHLESKVGVVNGLAYTRYGGDVLPIEVNYYPGKGNLVLTGSLGDVMKESAQIAYSYVKSNAKALGIDYNLFIKNDIHIHVPEGAIPKDGPSAGITLTTALISTLTNQKIDCTLAMTGEITLRGDIIPIGGLKEKSMGALRNGIKTIIIPYDNLNDVTELPKEIKDRIKFIPVHNYHDVYQVLSK